VASRGLRLAFVLPRYGAQLGGGAETLCRELILALLDPAKNDGVLPISKIEVWTTCARDHRTWENFHPPGSTLEDGIQVTRFPVDERDLETFIKAELAIASATPLSVNEQLGWLAGGVNSRTLYSHISREGEGFDAIVFAPYLFPTTFWGALIHPERSILIPCLHNEGYAYLEVMRVLLQRVRGLVFNAAPEGELAARIFGNENILSKGSVVGMGFDDVSLAEIERGSEPYILYSGRKEEGKNLGKLIEWFLRAKKEFPSLELRIIGSGKIEFLSELPPGVFDLGFVSEAEKASLMRNALVLCQPSVNESFSIVLMEAWLQETPVIVHRDCDVTKFHAVVSGGGLYCADGAEFSACIRALLGEKGLRERLGWAGQAYVRDEYSWKNVLRRFATSLRQFQNDERAEANAC